MQFTRHDVKCRMNMISWSQWDAWEKRLVVPLNSRLVSHNTIHRVRIRRECGSTLYQKRIDGRKTRGKSFTYARARTSALSRGISLAYKTLFAQEAVNSELFGGKFQRTTSSCKIKQRGMSLSGAGPSRISEIALRPRGRAVKRIPDEWTSSNRRDRSCPNPLSYSVLHAEFGRDSTIGERESGTQWTSDCGSTSGLIT